MSKFLGVRLTGAEPMTRGAYNLYRGWEIPDNENPEDKGYLVIGSDDHTSWFPKAEFDKQNFPIVGDDNKINIKDVEAMIDKVYSVTSELPDSESKTTIVSCVLVNGFIITESSACVDPKNYSKEIGTEICMEKIKDKIWFLLGFMLQSGVYGFKGDK